MEIKQMASIIGVPGYEQDCRDIKWLLTDSRSLSLPEISAFFAIETARNDGHKYIYELYERGVRCFIISHDLPDADKMSDAALLKVNDTTLALQQLAAFHRMEFDVPVIGITGSNGKTIVKEWLHQLLLPKYNVTRSPRSYNSQIGVPLSVWQMNAETQIALFEAGMSMPGEMERLQRVIRPTIGIFTNIGDAHQENFATLEQKCREKMRLFDGVELLVYSKDMPLIDRIAKENNLPTLTWGVAKDADIRIVEKHSGENETEIIYAYKGQEGRYVIPFNDVAAVENSLHCLALLLYLGYTHTEIRQLMAKLKPIAMRLEVKQGIRGNMLINDSYNNDLLSLTIALDFLDWQAEANKLSRTVLLSDIMQSGLQEQDLYQTVADMLLSRKVERLVAIGQNISRYRKCFCEIPSVSFYPTTEQYIASTDYRSIKDSVVLLKGSRSFSFEQVSKHLEMIAHETVLEVNLSALVENFNYFRSKLKRGTKIMCMVKAFAYGSGAVEVARTLQHHGCDYLAVAVADEGAELRRAGIHIPIVVMDPEMNALDVIIDNELEPEIYNMRMLKAFANAVRKQGLSHYPVHIKIDSGMHRLGFEWADMEELIAALREDQTLTVQSVFSHLAGADEARFDDFTAEQIRRFKKCADALAAAFPYPIMRHILNSVGIERFTDYQFDMVRLGIGHYGFSALPSVQLRNVCTLKTVILQIKHVAAGESVGYSRKAMLKEDKRIAVLPIGYADGFDRKLGNGVGEVLVNGKRCPVVGNICMDLVMIDVTHADAKEGDIAIIFGDELPIDELAQKLNTISYEVLTGVSRRVKRVYYQE